MGSTCVDSRASMSGAGWFPIEHLADRFHRRPRASQFVSVMVYSHSHRSPPHPTSRRTCERMRQCRAANTSSILLHCLAPSVIRYVDMHAVHWYFYSLFFVFAFGVAVGALPYSSLSLY